MEMAVFFIGCPSANERLLVKHLLARHSAEFFPLEMAEVARFRSEGATYAAHLRESHARQIEACLQTIKAGKTKSAFVSPVYFPETLEVIKRRSCFYLVAVEAPHTFQANLAGMDLEEYATVGADFNAVIDTRALKRHAQCSVRLEGNDEAALERALRGSFLEKVLRTPGSLFSVQEYFMCLALCARRRSNCLREAVACVLVRDGDILSISYNGTAQGRPNCLEGGCAACQDWEGFAAKIDLCCCIHALRNALFDVGKQAVQGCDVYLTCTPCRHCRALIVDAVC